MRSMTKFRVTNEQIHNAFKAAGISEINDVKEISDGWYNSVFSVADKSGKKYVIKIAPEKSVKVLTHEKDMMASEVNFYRLISEKTAIKTPQIVFTDFSEKVMPTAYFIMDFLDGERLDKAKLSPAEKEQADKEWAWLFSELHKIKGAGYGYEQAGLKDNWKDGLTHMTQILIDDAASFGKKCRVGKKLLKYIDKFADILKDVPSVLVNFDLHPMNIFCERTVDGIRLSVLDLERGFWGDRVGDFISVGLFKPLDKKKIITNYNAYAENKINVSGNEGIRYQIMNAYLATIMYTERFSRFKGVGKFFSPVYIGGTAAYIILARGAFSALKKLSK